MEFHGYLRAMRRGFFILPAVAPEGSLTLLFTGFSQSARLERHVSMKQKDISASSLILRRASFILSKCPMLLIECHAFSCRRFRGFCILSAWLLLDLICWQHHLSDFQRFPLASEQRFWYIVTDYLSTKWRHYDTLSAAQAPIFHLQGVNRYVDAEKRSDMPMKALAAHYSLYACLNWGTITRE